MVMMQGSTSSKLNRNDKTNVALAMMYHCTDLLTVVGWPPSTEVKDTQIQEVLDQANSGALQAQWTTTDLTQSILYKESPIYSTYNYTRYVISFAILAQLYEPTSK